VRSGSNSRPERYRRADVSKKRGEVFCDGEDYFTVRRAQEARRKERAERAAARRTAALRRRKLHEPEQQGVRGVPAIRMAPVQERDPDFDRCDDGIAPSRRPRKIRASRDVRSHAGPVRALPNHVSGIDPKVPMHSIAPPLVFRDDSEGADPVLFVGIDAGTSGIRIALREVFEPITRLFDFGANRAGGTRFSFPAIVAVRDGRLRFGNDAVGAPRETRFASFKGGFVHPARDREMAAQWSALGLPFTSALCGDALPSVTDFLYSVTLARALELALPTLAGGEAVVNRAHLSFGVGAPVGDDPGEAERYRRALGCAVGLYGSVGPNPLIERLVANWAHVWSSSIPLCNLDAGEMRLHVRHEVDSAIRPFERLMTFGSNFLIADIGATTTEVAVLKVGQETVSCFASRSIPIGVDDLDRNTTGDGARGLDVVSARVRRTDPAGDSDAEAREAEGAARSVAGDLVDVLRSVLHLAVKADQSASSWRNVFVVVAGGGSHVAALRRIFATDVLPHPFIENRTAVDIRLAAMAVCGASRLHPEPGELPELISVLGSAVPPWEGRRFRTPDQIEGAVSNRIEWEVDHSLVK
jgi:hypothetical protein